MSTPRSTVVRWASSALISVALLPTAAWAGEEPGVLARGAEIFAREWVPGDPRSRDGDGLGPVFNDSSCVACHGLGAPGGAGPSNKNAVILSVIGVRFVQARSPGEAKLKDELAEIHPGFRNARSVVLHRSGVELDYAGWLRDLLYSGEVAPLTRKVVDRRPGRKTQGKAPVGVEEEIRANALGSPSAARTFTVTRAKRSATLTVSERNTPSLFGAGLIDAVPVTVLKKNAERQGASIRGRLHDMGQGRVGRFGWKAQTANLREFVLVACAGELGLEVPGEHQARSPLSPDKAAKGRDLSEADCDALIAYVRTLPAPVALRPTRSQDPNPIDEGREQFEALGCAGCHTPDLGDLKGVYSDLLLHHMGQSLNDGGEYYGDGSSPGGANPDEWRTPPLWGFRDTGPYLHDGRARTLDEAVAHHGGQAADSARKFFDLSAATRLRVESFLKSLVASPAGPSEPVVVANDTEADAARRRRAETERMLLIGGVAEERRSAAEARADARRMLDEAEKARDEARLLERRGPAELRRLQEDARRTVETSLWRAESKLRAAGDLERAGKAEGALKFYCEVVRDFRDTTQGRIAAERIAALSK